MLTTPHYKNWACYEAGTFVSGLELSLVLPKQWKRDMRFGTENVMTCIGQGYLRQLPGN